MVEGVDEVISIFSEATSRGFCGVETFIPPLTMEDELCGVLVVPIEMSPSSELEWTWYCTETGPRPLRIHYRVD